MAPATSNSLAANCHPAVHAIGDKHRARNSQGPSRKPSPRYVRQSFPHGGRSREHGTVCSYQMHCLHEYILGLTGQLHRLRVLQRQEPDTITVPFLEPFGPTTTEHAFNVVNDGRGSRRLHRRNRLVGGPGLTQQCAAPPSAVSRRQDRSFKRNAASASLPRTAFSRVIERRVRGA